MLVADTDGQVIGVCQLIVFRHLQTRGPLCGNRVGARASRLAQPRHRALLMRPAIETARQLGCYRVQLTSNNDRPDAHRFYVALGFEPSHTGFKLLLR